MLRLNVMQSFILIIILIIMSIAVWLFYEKWTDTPVNRVVYTPGYVDEVLNNPYMGFSVDARYDDPAQPFRLAHANMTWRELEPRKGEYAFDEVEAKNRFDHWERQGVKLVLRILLDDPGDEDHTDIPDWLFDEIDGQGYRYDMAYGKGFSPDYTNPVLIERHQKLIEALAGRYANDPFIAFIQLGSVGHWGEWHTWDRDPDRIPFPGRVITDQYVEPYLRYFPDTFLLMRRPHDIALEHGMGLFNDAFGDAEQTVDGFLDWINNGYASWLTEEEQPAMPDYWVKAPGGGEFAHETKYVENGYIDETLRMAELTHISWIGPQGPYRMPVDSELQPNIDRLLKTIGYRYVVLSESHEMQRRPGDVMSVDLRIDNQGVAPFYFPWPVELSLIDGAGKVAGSANANLDIREWLPGSHQVNIKVKVPADLTPGDYRVAVAIIDPETGMPGIEFANEGKRLDGRYALGTVQIIL